MELSLGDGCSDITLKEAFRPNSGDVIYSALTVPIANLDPKHVISFTKETITTSRGKHTMNAAVIVNTIDLKKLVHRSSWAAQKHLRDSYTFFLRMTFNDDSIAKRVGRAFEHVINLCQGRYNKEPF